MNAPFDKVNASTEKEVKSERGGLKSERGLSI